VRRFLHLFIAAATIASISDVLGQVKGNFTISGTIKSLETGEVLIGAAVIVNELENTGASSNAYGFYSLTIPAGNYTIRVQYLGFKMEVDSIEMDQSRTINFALAPQPITEKEVVVSNDLPNDAVTSTRTSTYNLQVQQLKTIPVIFGEQDILKTIQLLPGIETASEGSTAFYVRGGGQDQNLILLDEAPVYNPTHLFGFLSVFNSDAINNIRVITGGIPADYGGRLSSVIDIRTDDGNYKEFGATGGIGLLDSRLTLDGPIVKDQGSFIISGRRTYADLFLRLSSNPKENGIRCYFYDLNAKVNYALGERDRIYLSGYSGEDNFHFPGGGFGLEWGNTASTLRWNHIFGDKFFSNTSLIYDNYKCAEDVSDVGGGAGQIQITSGVEDLNFKSEFQYFMNSDNTIDFGINSIYHTFSPGSISAESIQNSAIERLALQHEYSLENAAYGSDQASLLPDLKADFGLRLSSSMLLGPGSYYTFNKSGYIVDTTHYGTGKIVKTFVSLEPRLALTFILNDENSIKASYDRTAQYLHLPSGSTLSMPFDIWLPSTNNVPPSYADQVELGYFKNFDNDQFESSLVLYYKLMHNFVDYRDGANLQDLELNPAIESMILHGLAWSYGAELMVKKKVGPITGWLSYTLSRTEEKIPQINNGNPFPAAQDRIHDLSAVITAKLSDNWTIGATWVYYSGNAVTFPTGDYMIDGLLVPYYTSKNAYRMPPYSRLDISATWTTGNHSNLNFSLYNVYNRQNAFVVNFRQDPNNPERTEALQTSVFPIMPSITYNFNF